MYRPPARELCLDVLESIWRDSKYTTTFYLFLLMLDLVDEVKAPAGKILAKWRPRVFQEDDMSSNLANTVETMAEA